MDSVTLISTTQNLYHSETNSLHSLAQPIYFTITAGAGIIHKFHKQCWDVRHVTVTVILKSAV